MKRSLSKRAQSIAVTALSNQREIGHRKDIVQSKRPLYRSLSCPCLSSTTKQPICIQSFPSAVCCNKVNKQFRRQRFVPKMFINFIQRRAASTAPNILNNLGNVCACPCACPCAPCGCNCLPPPCNTPAKCLQYMTGYYYYPYGTWFCGPYHVSTGSCGPCAGPVRPGGACGPAPPCPGGPCGPPCIGPCSPCGPLSCCGVCSVGGPFSCYSVGSPQDYSSTFSSMGAFPPYQQFSPNQYMQQNCYTPFNPYTNFNQFGQYNSLPQSHFGPCYDMPMPTPVPVNTAFVPMQPMQPMQGTFEQEPYMPTPISNPQSFTYSKPTIRDIPSNEALRSSPSIDGPCPKNLSPKTLRMAPVSRYDASMNLSKNARSPKVVSRVLREPQSLSVCYFSTKSIQKQSSNDIETFDNATDINGSDTYKMLHETKCKESINRPLCYWCTLNGRYARNKGCIVAAQKLDTTHARKSRNFQNKLEGDIQ